MKDDPNLHEKLYRMAALAQEAELVFADKGQHCENYTSEATAEARAIQKRLLAFLPDPTPRLRIDEMLHTHYEPLEQKALSQGRPHTQLFTHSLGLSYIIPQHEKNQWLPSIEGALLKQEMGSSSSVAMQRGSALLLGGFSLLGHDEGIHEWNITGLRIEKFRDQLNRVSSVGHSSRGFGLGLTVLDYKYRKFAHYTHGSLAGIALTGNLLSSWHHKAFLNVSAGSDWAHHQENHDDTLALDFPLKIESLVSSTRVEWRNKASFTASSSRQIGDSWHVNSSLALYLGEFKGREIKLRLSFDHEQRSSTSRVPNKQERSLAQIQFEINRW